MLLVISDFMSFLIIIKFLKISFVISKGDE